jgi:hypothetical protein
MVHAEFWRPGSEIGQSECIATLTQRGHSQPQIEGREPRVVNLERLVLSVSTGEAIRWEDDPEERGTEPDRLPPLPVPARRDRPRR